MQRKLLYLTAAFIVLSLSRATPVQAEAGITPEHTPPVQVYQGVAFRLQVKPLTAAKKMVVHLNLAGLELSMPMRALDISRWMCPAD
ncbi:MAG: hypothetical protein ACM3ZC_10280 [Bacteroidota bacterium]